MYIIDNLYIIFFYNLLETKIWNFECNNLTVFKIQLVDKHQASVKKITILNLHFFYKFFVKACQY